MPSDVLSADVGASGVHTSLGMMSGTCGSSEARGADNDAGDVRGNAGAKLFDDEIRVKLAPAATDSNGAGEQPSVLQLTGSSSNTRDVAAYDWPALAAEAWKNAFAAIA